tara:strand:+ start:5779 stop:6720 length:942 start_codon:yes stop_codon:yes gene_type:complete
MLSNLPDFTKFKEEFTHELVTIRDTLRWIVTKFEEYDLYFGHGTDNAWDEALLLLYFCFKIPQSAFSNILDSKVCLSEKAKIWEYLIKRIVQKKPLAYITNESWFSGMSFYIDERALIPRSPIAELINNNFEPHIEVDPENILELCTGSACIACVLAIQYPDAKVDAIDICDDALEVAKINVSDYNLENNVTLIKSDLFDKVPGKKYDLIVVNPPYVTQEELDAMSEEYNHEPRKALYAKEQGLEFVVKILEQSGNYLNENGLLVIELGDHELDLHKRYPNINFLWHEFENGGSGVFIMKKTDLDSSVFRKDY